MLGIVEYEAMAKEVAKECLGGCRGLSSVALTVVTGRTIHGPWHDYPAESKWDMNAVERFLIASRAHDVDAAATELADDVVMLNPATDDPIVGKEAVSAALRAVEAACDQFRHTHLLAERDPSEEVPLYGLVFEAKVGEHALRGVDLIELNAQDRIVTFSVATRPIAGLMALGARMGGNQT